MENDITAAWESHSVSSVVVEPFPSQNVAGQVSEANVTLLNDLGLPCRSEGHGPATVASIDGLS